MRIFLFLVFGLVSGAVAGMIVPGRTPRRWGMAMAIGAAGSMVGGLLASALGLNVQGSRLAFVISILGAVSWLAIYHVLLRRTGAHPHRDGSLHHERRSTDVGRRSTDARLLSQRDVSARSGR